MSTLPFRITPRLRSSAVLLGGAFLGIGVFHAESASWLTPLGVLALFFGGLGMQVPQWAAVRPLVPLSLAPLVLGAAELLQHPVSLPFPLPEPWKPYLPLVAGLLALLGGKVIPLQGTQPEAAAPPRNVRTAVARALSGPGGGGVAMLCLCLCAGLILGCTAGPRRITVAEAFHPAEEGTEVKGLAAEEVRPGEELPLAGPFSVGVALAVSYHPQAPEGERLMPAQLLMGSLKVAEAGPRALNLVGFGGVQGTSLSQARPAWGFGAGVELTPGGLLYEVSATAGILWVKDKPGAGAVVGLSISPKM